MTTRPFCDFQFGLCASLRTQEKAKQKTTTTKMESKEVLFRVCVWGVPVQPIVIIFGTARNFADLIKLAKFCIDWSKGFGLRKGQRWGLPYRKSQWPLPLCVALSYTHVTDWKSLSNLRAVIRASCKKNCLDSCRVWPLVKLMYIFFLTFTSRFYRRTHEIY